MSEKLKNCPFCGGNELDARKRSMAGFSYESVCCRDCLVEANKTTWQQRTKAPAQPEPHPPTELVERCASAVKNIFDLSLVGPDSGIAPDDIAKAIISVILRELDVVEDAFDKLIAANKELDTAIGNQFTEAELELSMTHFAGKSADVFVANYNADKALAKLRQLMGGELQPGSQAESPVVDINELEIIAAEAMWKRDYSQGDSMYKSFSDTPFHDQQWYRRECRVVINALASYLHPSPAIDASVLEKVRELIYQIAVLNAGKNKPIADWADQCLALLNPGSKEGL